MRKKAKFMSNLCFLNITEWRYIGFKQGTHFIGKMSLEGTATIKTTCLFM